MAIHEPERIWWKPLSKDERWWVTVALIWALFTFFFMPVYKVMGNHTPPNETYTISSDDFDKLTENMVSKYKVGEEQGMPIVHVPADVTDVYIRAKMWEWYPILQLDKGKEYRLHLSSMDLNHGFSLQPIDMNFMVFPGYDNVLKITPTTSGEFHIVCNEFCGFGHHTMAGKLYVKD